MSETRQTASARPSNLATLAIVYRFPEAATLISMLRAYGIPAFAPAWNFATVNWHFTVGMGGIAVLVPSRDLEAAIALVGDPRDIPAPPRNFHCGRLCNILIALLFFAFGIGVLPPRAKGVYAVVTPHA